MSVNNYTTPILPSNHGDVVQPALSEVVCIHGIPGMNLQKLLEVHAPQSNLSYPFVQSCLEGALNYGIVAIHLDALLKAEEDDEVLARLKKFFGDFSRQNLSEPPRILLGFGVNSQIITPSFLAYRGISDFSIRHVNLLPLDLDNVQSIINRDAVEKLYKASAGIPEVLEALMVLNEQTSQQELAAAAYNHYLEILVRNPLLTKILECLSVTREFDVTTIKHFVSDIDNHQILNAMQYLQERLIISWDTTTNSYRAHDAVRALVRNHLMLNENDEYRTLVTGLVKYYTDLLVDRRFQQLRKLYFEELIYAIGLAQEESVLDHDLRSNIEKIESLTLEEKAKLGDLLSK